MAIQNDDQASIPLPVWISIPIILLCLAAGGWMIHWYVISDPIGHDLKVLGEPARVSILSNLQNPWVGPGRGGNGNGNRNPNFNPNRSRAPIVELTEDKNRLSRLFARTDTVEEGAVLNPAGQISAFHVTYTNNGIIPKDARETLVATEALLRMGKEHLDAMKLNPNDQQKLRNLSFNPSEVALTPADRNTIRDMTLKYFKATVADRLGMQPGLLKLLDDVAQRSVPATVQGAADRAKQVNQILTPEMWKLSQTLAAKPAVLTPAVVSPPVPAPAVPAPPVAAPPVVR